MAYSPDSPTNTNDNGNGNNNDKNETPSRGPRGARERRKKLLLASKKKNSSSNKKVQFNNDEQVNVVETVSPEEKPSLWYTHKDLKSRERDCKNIVVFQDDEQANGEEKIMSLLSSSSSSAAHSSRDFVTSVLRQQQEHKQLGVNDPKGLYQLSRACSKRSRQRALQLGRDQAREVQSFEERKRATINVIGDALDLLLLPGTPVTH